MANPASLKCPAGPQKGLQGNFEILIYALHPPFLAPLDKECLKDGMATEYPPSKKDWYLRTTLDITSYA